MATSIRISSLDVLPVIKSSDFIPIVQSGSAALLTTYRTPISAINGFLSVSGSVLSASWASSSISSSYSKLSDSASYLYPTIIYKATASVSISSSYSSFALTSSLSNMSISASHAILSDSASYLFPTILYRTTSSWSANSVNSNFSISSSWASQSLSSSFSTSASYSKSGSFSSNSNNSVSSSYALTAASVITTHGNTVFLNPTQSILSGSGAYPFNGDTTIFTWRTYNVSASVPQSSSAILLNVVANNGNGSIARIELRKNNSSPIHLLGLASTGGGFYYVTVNQSAWPVSSDGSFQLQIVNGFTGGGVNVKLIGYIS